MASNTKNTKNTNGRITILVAIIGLIGTWGSIVLNHYLNSSISNDAADSSRFSEYVQGEEYKISTKIEALALRKRILTDAEVFERNKCGRTNQLSSECQRIDNETFVLTLRPSRRVVFLEKEGDKWVRIRDVETGQTGFISRNYGDIEILN
ncbi:SH3 domain-containing protein [Lewinella cohaerens]|uniref:SH3 domain-containing protein n=1 Tax=Lewinella cohaerens TaxID=70995 RepID=UPI000380F159|nr:SH3 domain-containing protein [Lewinella cohaerens]